MSNEGKVEWIDLTGADEDKDDGTSEEMVLDDVQSDSSEDEKSWEDFERAWSRLSDRWRRDGFPNGQYSLARLLGALEQEANEASEGIARGPHGAPGNIARNAGRQFPVLPQRGSRIRRFRGNERIGGEAPEGWVRRLFD